ncbi:MAG: hypothetical protein QW784_02445 [Acidilobaceae archaeon]
MRMLAGLGLMVLMLLATLTPGTTVFSQTTSSRGLEAIIDYEKQLLEALKSMVPDISPQIDEAISRLEEAKAKASIDPESALREAVMAQIQALNVGKAREVLSRVNITAPPGLIVALNVRLRMISEINATITYLKSMNITVNPEIEVKLGELTTRVVQTREKLLAGKLRPEEVANIIGEVSRELALIKTEIVREYKQEWGIAQAVNAVVRVKADTVSSLELVLPNLEKLNLKDLEDVVIRIENVVLFERRAEELLGVEIPPEYKCDVKSVIEKLTGLIDLRVEPGFLGRIIASLVAEGKIEELKGLLIEYKRCLIQPLKPEIIEKTPGLGKDVAEKAKHVAEMIRTEITRAVDIKIILVQTGGRPDLILAPPRIELNIKPETREGNIKFKNVGALTVKKDTTVILKPVNLNTDKNLEVIISLVIELESKDRNYTINMPCALANTECSRIMVLIPGYDIPLSIKQGEYNLNIIVSWNILGTGKAEGLVGLSDK